MAKKLSPIAHPRTVTYQYRTPGDGVVADLEAPIALLRQDGTARARYDYDRTGNLVRRRVGGAVAADPIDEHTFVYDGDQRQRAASAPNGTRQVDYYDSGGSRALQVLKGSGGAVTRVRLWFGPLEVWYTPAGVAEKQWAHVAHGVSIARVDLHPTAPTLGGIQPDAVVSEPSGVEFQFHSQLGHMLVSLNESMHAVGGFQYGPFGEVLAQVGSPDDHLRRFNGKEFDKTTGLSYYGFRHYDPLSMTWTQADPLFRFAPDLAFDEPRRMNLYSFSLNNPMRYLDPDGRNAAVAACAGGPLVCALAVGGTLAVAALLHKSSTPSLPDIDDISIDLGTSAVATARRVLQERVRQQVLHLAAAAAGVQAGMQASKNPGASNASDSSDNTTNSDTSDANQGGQDGRRASDSSKNEKHGDGGRALTKAEQQIKVLEEKMKAASGREKKRIDQKIKNIRKTAAKAKKGTEHSVGSGGKKQSGRATRH